MGRFSYNHASRTYFDDRTLMHLQVVIKDKLARGEPFNFTWMEDASLGGGRMTVWINQASSLQFKYDGPRSENLNRAWLEVLAQSANSPDGLRVIPEPPEDPVAG
ncbi:ATP-dependent DNA ligase [Microbacterium mangrovi]|uniref:ATP-dependent DNA ligase n=1 Tax=Microbacterium mangrovi TaxID=1348253 RepID=A0A0B2AB47_9MICO|nr:hypothetical protein [Microbacterium mangrovi]KHK99018.1 ATP-dependent DNA ligase [Microbacterium mangrovi]